MSHGNFIERILMFKSCFLIFAILVALCLGFYVGQGLAGEVQEQEIQNLHYDQLIDIHNSEGKRTYWGIPKAVKTLTVTPAKGVWWAGKNTGKGAWWTGKNTARGVWSGTKFTSKAVTKTVTSGFGLIPLTKGTYRGAKKTGSVVKETGVGVKEAAGSGFGVPEYVRDLEREGSLAKLGRGVGNVFWSGFEIPTHIKQSVEEKGGFFRGFFEGTFEGTYWAVGRAAVGAYEVGTFFLPLSNEPIMKPESPLDSAREAWKEYL